MTEDAGKKIERGFYLRDTVDIARDLIGCLLFHKTPQGLAGGMIVETEAYCGPEDAAAHSYKNRKSARTAIQYGPGGYAYIFKIYGMYDCMNIVTREEGQPHVVLIRALEPVEGIQLMKKRRRVDQEKKLCSGPGKLCMALGIDKSCYGLDLCARRLYLEHGPGGIDQRQIGVSRRINIDYAGPAKEYPWRFFLKGSEHVSVRSKN